MQLQKRFARSNHLLPEERIHQGTSRFKIFYWWCYRTFPSMYSKKIKTLLRAQNVNDEYGNSNQMNISELIKWSSFLWWSFLTMNVETLLFYKCSNYNSMKIRCIFMQWKEFARECCKAFHRFDTHLSYAQAVKTTEKNYVSKLLTIFFFFFFQVIGVTLCGKSGAQIKAICINIKNIKMRT